MFLLAAAAELVANRSPVQTKGRPRFDLGTGKRRARRVAGRKSAVLAALFAAG
jgi:hypothetical protein